MNNDPISTCLTCGYAWPTGTNGEHYCIDELLKSCSETERELAAVKEVLWPNQTGLPNKHRNAAIAVAAIVKLSKEALADKDAQIVALRGCLDHLQRKDWFIDQHYPYDGVLCTMDASKVRAALSTPPPPCVPLEDVMPLLDALRSSYDVQDWPGDESTQAKALAAFLAKHPQP